MKVGRLQTQAAASRVLSFLDDKYRALFSFLIAPAAGETSMLQKPHFETSYGLLHFTAPLSMQSTGEVNCNRT